MTRLLPPLAALLCVLAAAAAAQAQKPAPVEDARGGEAALLQGQHRAGIAYRELQQARYESKLAEQDVLNAEEAWRAAQKHADELRRQLDVARKALQTARSREAAARAAYDKEVDAIDRLQRAPPAGK
jgi:septal ring factor EnvC (AmiA/AmiB activator)